MKAEHIIGLEIVFFLLGYFARDLKSLGAASPSRERYRVNSRRSAAPKNSRKAW